MQDKVLNFKKPCSNELLSKVLVSVWDQGEEGQVGLVIWNNAAYLTRNIINMRCYLT